MTTRNWNSSLTTDRLSTLQNAPNGCRAKYVNRHAYERERHDGRSTHGIDIRDCVGGGDTSKRIRIINNWHKEVCGSNDGLVLINLIDSSIIRGANAYKQFIGYRHGHRRFEHLRK